MSSVLVVSGGGRNCAECGEPACLSLLVTSKTTEAGYYLCETHLDELRDDLQYAKETIREIRARGLARLAGRALAIATRRTKRSL
jgi:hypothetical protein